MTNLAVRDPLRVALVITDLEVGGAEKCLTQLALNLDRERFRPAIFVLQPRPEAQRAALVRQLESAGLDPLFLNASSILSFPRVLWRLRKEIAKFSPHVVQTLLYHANVLGALAINQQPNVKLATGLRVADPRPRRLALERWATRKAAKHVAVSDGVARFYELAGFDSSGIIRIPNSIDVASYRDCQAADLSASGVPSACRVAMFIGRLDERQKGIGGFLSSCRPLLEELPDLNIVIVGDGPDRQAIENVAREVMVSTPKLSGRIHLLGWRSDIPHLLKRASVLLLPSRYEGMPNVLLEALAAGTPVLASRQLEGNADLFAEFTNDFTAPFGNWAAWRTDIINRLNDHVKTRQLVHWAQQRVTERFTIQSMVNAYQKLWLGMCTNS